MENKLEEIENQLEIIKDLLIKLEKAQNKIENCKMDINYTI